MQVWEYEGAQTLGSFLRRRDCVRALALDLGVAEADAVPAVMRQLLQSLHVRRFPLLRATAAAAAAPLDPPGRNSGRRRRWPIGSIRQQQLWEDSAL